MTTSGRDRSCSVFLKGSMILIPFSSSSSGNRNRGMHWSQDRPLRVVFWLKSLLSQNQNPGWGEICILWFWLFRVWNHKRKGPEQLGGPAQEGLSHHCELCLLAEGQVLSYMFRECERQEGTGGCQPKQRGQYLLLYQLFLETKTSHPLASGSWKDLNCSCLLF